MNLTDRLICEADTALRTLFASPVASRLPSTIGPEASSPALSEVAAGESVRLMRVNHCGEVCAQALYQGQALVARTQETRASLERAAHEERDHLAWCNDRVRELGGQTSVTAPLFYAGSFALGVASGLMGDRWSLGFLVETERQVEAHLDGHLTRLDPADCKSRAIVETMRADEIRHGNAAEAQGARELPVPVKGTMRLLSKVMTAVTYRV
jgi:ubiquinone biosynthesis monooxygenase Coq7